MPLRDLLVLLPVEEQQNLDMPLRGLPSTIWVPSGWIEKTRPKTSLFCGLRGQLLFFLKRKKAVNICLDHCRPKLIIFSEHLNPFIGWICSKSADQVRSNFNVCVWNRFTFLWFFLSTKERGGFIFSGGFFFEPNLDCRLPHEKNTLWYFTNYMKKIFAEKFTPWAFFVIRVNLIF